jgi:hypothetical protein
MAADSKFVSLVEKLNSYTECVKKILDNFKKSPNRKNSEEFLNSKALIVKEERQKYGQVVKQVLLNYKSNAKLKEILPFK